MVLLQALRDFGQSGHAPSLDGQAVGGQVGMTGGVPWPQDPPAQVSFFDLISSSFPNLQGSQFLVRIMTVFFPSYLLDESQLVI